MKVLLNISQRIESAGGQCFLVGGMVRDAFFGRESKDIDVECFGIDWGKLVEILSDFGKVSTVGAAFAVAKLTVGDDDFDFSLPRRENRVGVKHNDFTVVADSTMGVREAAMRRDFTINAMSRSMSGELVDPFDGRVDIELRILRAVNAATFVEDALRVLRGCQFAARFGLTVAPDTMELFKQLAPELVALPSERVFEELKKLLLKSDKPSVGFEIMRECGALEVLFPELAAMIDVPQDPAWHPEGSVISHTWLVIDEAAKLRTGDEHRDLCLMLGALCHDLGKVTHTKFEGGRWRSKGHEKAGEAPTRSFLARLTNQSDIIEIVVPLVVHHLRPCTLFVSAVERGEKVGDGAFLRLARKCDVGLLVLVAKADHFGRTTPDALARECKWWDWFTGRVAETGADKAVVPLMMGRHLIGLGMKPGPLFGKLLADAFEAQMDGKITCEADGLEFLKSCL